MEPIDYLRVLRRRWPVVAAALLVAVVAAWLSTPSQPKTGLPVVQSYRALATLIQDPNATSPVNLDSTRFLVTVGQIPKAAAQRLHYSGDPALLAATVSASIDDKVGAMTITTTGTEGPRTAAIANAFANATVDYLRGSARANAQDGITALQPQLDDLIRRITDLNTKIAAQPQPNLILGAQRDALVSRYQSLFQRLQDLTAQDVAPASLTVLQAATPIPVTSGGGFTPPKSRGGRVGLAAGLGLLLGAALALVLERFDTRLRTRPAVEAAFRLPVIVEVPRFSRAQRRVRVVATALPRTTAAEAYRSLRSSLLLMPSRPIDTGSAPGIEPAPEHAGSGAAGPKPTDVTTPGQPLASPYPARHTSSPRVVLVTSARAGEGKTTTGANLAATMAETGRSVLVLGCDFRNPGMSQTLDVANSSGLSELLALGSYGDLASVVRPSSLRGVSVVPSGYARDHPAALLARCGPLIAAARGLADVVIIDSPPMLAANDATDLIPHVDSVVVVCRAGRVTAEQGARVSELLARMQVPIAGIALIGRRRTMVEPGGYYLMDVGSSAWRRPWARASAQPRGRHRGSLGTVASPTVAAPASVDLPAVIPPPSTVAPVTAHSGAMAGTTPPTTAPTVPARCTTASPVAEPPVAEPPEAEPRVAAPSVTEPRVAEPPVAEPPVAEPPVAEPLVAEPLVAEPPVAEPPVADMPAADLPVAEPRVAEPPVAEPRHVTPRSTRSATAPTPRATPRAARSASAPPPTASPSLTVAHATKREKPAPEQTAPPRTAPPPKAPSPTTVPASAWTANRLAVRPGKATPPSAGKDRPAQQTGWRSAYQAMRGARRGAKPSVDRRDPGAPP